MLATSEAEPVAEGPSRAAHVLIVDDNATNRRLLAAQARQWGLVAETFDSGIRKTVRWFLDHPEWVAEVQSGAYRDWLAANYATR